MELIPVEIIRFNSHKLDQIDKNIQSIYRLITYSRHHLADDLLDTYLNGITDLKNLLSIKNAQMEAQSEDEVKEYLLNLKNALDFVVEEIVSGINFVNELQLFQLLRLISPETSARHPNRYRPSVVQVGAHVCPDPLLVPQLVTELFYKMNLITNPVIRAIYFHHELIRIHPFADGNGRVTRIAKNWMFMYNLYPPIFIGDAPEKKLYISTLSSSFKALQSEPNQWNNSTEQFFEQELDRLLTNTSNLYTDVYSAGVKREELMNKVKD